MKFTALVTGSSRGMGYSIVQKLLEQSAHVIGTSTKPTSPFDHSNYAHVQVDLSNPEDIETKLKPLFEGDSVPEVVVNNAGIFEDADFDIQQNDWLANWDRTQQVNLRSPLLYVNGQLMRGKKLV